MGLPRGGPNTTSVRDKLNLLSLGKQGGGIGNLLQSPFRTNTAGKGV